MSPRAFDGVTKGLTDYCTSVAHIRDTSVTGDLDLFIRRHKGRLDVNEAAFIHPVNVSRMHRRDKVSLIRPLQCLSFIRRHEGRLVEGDSLVLGKGVNQHTRLGQHHRRESLADSPTCSRARTKRPLQRGCIYTCIYIYI